MNIETVVVGPLDVNAYVFYEAAGSTAVVVDPGADADEILALIRSASLKVTHIVNTHGHGDHIGANAALKEAFPAARLCIHARDAHMLSDVRANFSHDFGFDVTSPPADVTLTGNTELNAAGIRFRIEHVPGHSPGSVCLVGLFEPRIVVTGDTLFAGGVGRTDFPGGNMGLLHSGIKEKILSLSDETIVLPGHGIRTTVGMERRSNPWVGDVRWPQEPDADDEAGAEPE